MKYIDLSNQKHLLGYNGFNKKSQTNTQNSRFLNIGANLANNINADSLRFEYLNTVLAVDKFKVTECEFVNVLWDSIPNKLESNNLDFQNFWISKKKNMIKEKCDIHDSAAIIVPPYLALIYANSRSLRDGLSPVYNFEYTQNWKSLRIFENGDFGVKRESFSPNNKDYSEYVIVHVNKESNGYRLPYYHEWMALARGGQTNIKYIWGNEENDSLASKYAWYGIQDPDDPLKNINPRRTYEKNWIKNSCGHWIQKSRPVGILKPNNFDLFDISGLVCEIVMLPEKNIFDNEILTCKGGFLSDTIESLNLGSHCDYKASNDFIYRGLRLVRQIK